MKQIRKLVFFFFKFSMQLDIVLGTKAVVRFLHRFAPHIKFSISVIEYCRCRMYHSLFRQFRYYMCISIYVCQHLRKSAEKFIKCYKANNEKKKLSVFNSSSFLLCLFSLPAFFFSCLSYSYSTKVFRHHHMLSKLTEWKMEQTATEYDFSKIEVWYK